MNKKVSLFSFGLPFCLVLLCSCLSAQAKTLKVVTTFTIFADMTQVIAGEKAKVVSITKAGAEIHNYQPTPRDIIKTDNADLILWHGMNLERWFEKFYQNVTDVPKLLLTKGITPLSISGGEYDGKPNPHAWMSTENALIYIENITQALITVDPSNADYYQQNAANYGNTIIDLVKPFKQQIQTLDANSRWLVTSEGAFSYLAKDLGLKELFIWPINADAQGSPKQMQRVIDSVNKHKIQAVFSESTVSDKPAKQIARETTSEYRGVLYVDSLSTLDGPVPTYLDLLKVTLQTIVEGLTHE